MSNTGSVKIASRERSVESAVEQIRNLLGDLDCLILAGIADVEVSGVIDDGEEIYREVLPLGEGIHIVLTVDLPTKMTAGIHEV